MLDFDGVKCTFVACMYVHGKCHGSFFHYCCSVRNCIVPMCTCDVCTVQVTLVCKSCQNKLIVPDAVSYHDISILELEGPSEVTMTWIDESGLGKLVGVVSSLCS